MEHNQELHGPHTMLEVVKLKAKLCIWKPVLVDGGGISTA
jgi:hypothetical protein